MMTSFRASAMRITLGALPAFSSRSANAASTALPWHAPQHLQVQHPTHRRATTGDESLPVPTTTVPVHRCHAHLRRRHLLAGQRAQLRQVRPTASGSSPDRSPESTATTRPWLFHTGLASIAWANSLSAFPISFSRTRRIASMLRRTEPPRRRQPVRLHQCASRIEPVCARATSRLVIPGSRHVASGALGGAAPARRIRPAPPGVQRVGLQCVVGPAPPRRSPVPAQGSPGSARKTLQEQEPRRRARASYPPVALDHDECWGQRFEPRDKGGDALGRVIEPPRQVPSDRPRQASRPRAEETSMPTNQFGWCGFRVEIPW